MQIARKLTLPLALSAVVVLGLVTAFSAKADLDLQEEDMERDQMVLAQVLVAAIQNELEHETLDEALKLVNEANRDQPRVLFLFLRDDELKTKGSLGPKEVETLARGQAFFHVDRAIWGTGSTFFPFRLPDGGLGTIWVQEPLSAQQASLRRVLGTQVTAALILAGLWALVAVGLGAVIVGRPMRVLTDQARRIGQGDLGHPLTLSQQDEIGELAKEMNAMSSQLSESRQRAEREMQQRMAAEEQLRHADRLNTVGKLASGLAHEVGTPLNVINGRARMIASAEVQGESAQASAKIITQQTETITRIIRQLLDFARRTPPSSTRANLSAVAQQTVTMLSPLAAKSGVKLELADAPKLELDFDQGQMQQVTTNLVINAVQAMPKGGTVRLVVSEAEETPPPDLGGPRARYAVLTVQDEGLGIAPEQLPRIFEPFFTTKDVGEGTGLGLSVAWGLVRDHHGWISVESTPGQGSRFSVHLPTERKT